MNGKRMLKGVEKEKEGIRKSIRANGNGVGKESGSLGVPNKPNGLFHTTRLQSVTIGMVTKGKFLLNVTALTSDDEEDEDSAAGSPSHSPDIQLQPPPPTRKSLAISRLLTLATETTHSLQKPSSHPTHNHPQKPTKPIPILGVRTQETSDQLFPPITPIPTSPQVKKVEFSPEVRMDPSDNANNSTDDANRTEGKNKKKGDQERSPTGSASGQGTPRRRSRSPSGNLLNEIRKMSLASQDAQEEKKKNKLAGESEVKKTFRRTTKRKKRREEEYTDKDRAAAVTLGSRDIKQSLKAKKKRERKMHMSLDLLTSEEFLSAMLVVEASFQMKVKKHAAAALTTLNKALELQPFHKGALIARSQCHLKLGDAASALKDAETSFDKNETYIQGLFQFAEALYQLGQFEKALIAYHRGYRLRKDMEGFRIGIQKSQEAIRRAIGDRSATQIGNLDDILPMINEMEAENKRKEEDGELWLNDEEHPTNPKHKSNEKSSRSNARARWVAREVLGQMYSDKDYLIKFLKRPDIKSDDGSSTALRDSANEALKYLEIREQFWRQQNPIYSRKTNMPHRLTRSSTNPSKNKHADN